MHLILKSKHCSVLIFVEEIFVKHSSFFLFSTVRPEVGNGKGEREGTSKRTHGRGRAAGGAGSDEGRGDVTGIRHRAGGRQRGGELVRHPSVRVRPRAAE